MGDFCGTGIEIWTGFGPVGIAEKTNIWADYEQLFRPFFFHVFIGKKIKIKLKIKNIVAPALKSCIK